MQGAFRVMAQVSLNQSFVQSITVVKPTTFTDKRLKGFQLTVSKAGTKVYYFKFSQAGRQFKVKLGKHPTMSFKEAKGLYLEKLQEIELGVNQQHRKQTLQYFMDNHYKLHLKSKNRSAHDSIKTLETHFLSWLGNRTIESITVTELATWRDKRLQSGISPNTVKRNLTEFKSMFNYLVNELGYLKENPIANLKSPKEVEPEEKLYLSSEEYQKILATIERYKFAGGVYMGIDMGANQEIKLRDIEPYDYVLEKVNLNIRPHVFPYYLAYALEIALFTGLRKSELLGLWWSHIDFDNRLITVTATTYETTRAIIKVSERGLSMC
jgi:integrase